MPGISDNFQVFGELLKLRLIHSYTSVQDRLCLVCFQFVQKLQRELFFLPVITVVQNFWPF